MKLVDPDKTYFNVSAFIKVQNVTSHHFSHQVARVNFSKKLGEGGFGSVFEGSLKDGSKIAVKFLEGLSHIKKSLLAEVQSIGSIHHVNLVRLKEFCAWKSQRFLVYDFMSNGSLNRWICHGVRKQILEWECRKKVILDIAKGLAYLHEDCRKKLVHLDIKPQNILLDDDFNAKVSDFGLSKLIDKSQTEVMTTIKGTPGHICWYHRHRKPRTSRNGSNCDRTHNHSHTNHNNHKSS
ncbi:putative protein kinase RLK-Pelle-SD-2b family [Helianthus debilis subsp. tardiflorus]